MARCGLEVADVFRRYGEAFGEHLGASLSTAQRRVMSAIETCRTAALGGHVEQCDHCDHQRISYNSCVMGKFRNGELTTGFIKLSVNFRDFALHYGLPSERSAQRALDQMVVREDAVEH
jgi:hypothetical protein